MEAEVAAAEAAEAAEAAFTPIVVFKKLVNRGASLDVPTCKMTFFSVQFDNSAGQGKEYFLLVGDADPSRPIRLYKSGMSKLLKQLDFAFKELVKIEEQPMSEDANFDCGIINAYGNMTLRVVIAVFKNQASIWLRLYSLNEENQILPTKTAVRFSTQDDVAALQQFVEQHTKGLNNFFLFNNASNNNNIDVDKK